MLIKASTDWSTDQDEEEGLVTEFPSPFPPPADKLVLGISSLDIILDVPGREVSARTVMTSSVFV